MTERVSRRPRRRNIICVRAVDQTVSVAALTITGARTAHLPDGLAADGKPPHGRRRSGVCRAVATPRAAAQLPFRRVARDWSGIRTSTETSALVHRRDG
jgi:hypothetical protein